MSCFTCLHPQEARTICPHSFRVISIPHLIDAKVPCAQSLRNTMSDPQESCVHKVVVIPLAHPSDARVRCPQSVRDIFVTSHRC